MNPSVWSLEPSSQRYNYYADFPFFRKSNDYHDIVAIYFLEEGAFTYRIGNREPATLEQGELVICPPHTNFNKSVLRTVTMHVVNLSLDDAGILPGEKISYSDDRRIGETLARLRGLMSQRALPTAAYRQHLVNDLWYSICAHMESPFVSYEQHTADPFFREMTAYIADHLDTSLSELAEVFCCSRVTVNNCFHRFTGGTVGEYIKNARIEQACVLIHQTNLPLKTIAPMCGFTTEYYFSSVFKARTGVTPGEYRKLSQTKMVNYNR